MVMDDPSRTLSVAVVHGYTLNIDSLHINHLLFVDNTILFSSNNEELIDNLINMVGSF